MTNFIKPLINFMQFSSLKVINLATKVLTNMGLHSETFANPLPSDEVFTSLITDATTKHNEYEQEKIKLKSLKEESDKATKKLKEALRQRANYVDFCANGDRAIIILSGLDTNKESTQHAKLPEKVDNVKVMASDNQGELLVTWESIMNATTCQVSASASPEEPNSWKVLGMSTKSTFTASELESGKKMVFRVCAFNSAGQGPDSNYVDKIVP